MKPIRKHCIEIMNGAGVTIEGCHMKNCSLCKFDLITLLNVNYIKFPLGGSCIHTCHPATTCIIKTNTLAAKNIGIHIEQPLQIYSPSIEKILLGVELECM